MRITIAIYRQTICHVNVDNAISHKLSGTAKRVNHRFQEMCMVTLNGIIRFSGAVY